MCEIDGERLKNGCTIPEWGLFSVQCARVCWSYRRLVVIPTNNDPIQRVWRNRIPFIVKSSFNRKSRYSSLNVLWVKVAASSSLYLFECCKKGLEWMLSNCKQESIKQKRMKEVEKLMNEITWHEIFPYYQRKLEKKSCF